MAEDCDACTKLEERNDSSRRRGEVKNIATYLRRVVAADPGYEVENKLLYYAFGAFAILLVLFSITFLFFGNSTYLKYSHFVFFSLITAISIAFSYYFISCHRSGMNCTNGMMVGMTTGMVIGFMAGAIIGATNGMFVGSIIGMAIGMALGFELGRYCGIMGAMEGVMAGVMAGTMGAMLSVMMLSDNLILFLYILFTICLFMLGGLTYMLKREGNPTKISGLNVNFLKFVLVSILLSILLLVLMFYGPKGPAVY